MNDDDEAVVRSLMDRQMDADAIARATGLRAPVVKKMILKIDAERKRIYDRRKISK